MRIVLAAIFGGIVGASLVSFAAFAWTGPASSAPSGNVAAPLNVGASDQVKNAGLSVNALAVFGSGYVQSKLGVGTAVPVSALDVSGDIVARSQIPAISWLGDISGARWVSGLGSYALTFYNETSSGSLSWPVSSVGAYSSTWYPKFALTNTGDALFAGSVTASQIKFPDGSTQTTAPASGPDSGTMCGIAIAQLSSSCLTDTDWRGNSLYSSVATCKGQSVAASCPTGYTKQTITTAQIYQTCTGACPVQFYCMRTCTKN